MLPVPLRSRRSTDRTLPSEGRNVGSTPAESTEELHAKALEGKSEAGLFAGGSVRFNDAALFCFIDCLIRRRKKLFGSGNIPGGERLCKQLSRIS